VAAPVPAPAAAPPLPAHASLPAAAPGAAVSHGAASVYDEGLISYSWVSSCSLRV
jgi:hypothetical protein